MNISDNYSGPIPGWLVGSALVVGMFLLGFAVVVAWRLARKKPLRFSLRTLLVAMSVCAVAAVIIPKLGEWMFPDSLFYFDLSSQPASSSGP